MNTPMLWKRYQQYLSQVPALGLALDVSRMRFEDGFLDQMTPALQRAFDAMDALERGAIANPDENRMVGHYWLRAPELEQVLCAGLARFPSVSVRFQTELVDLVPTEELFVVGRRRTRCRRRARAVGHAASIWPPDY